MTFLSIVTRCHPDRAAMQEINKASIFTQTDKDYEHILILDEEGRGVHWANQALQTADPAGEYVLILDDDDYLTDEKAIAKLRQATESKPDIVIFKANHGPLGILPDVFVWEKRPVRGRIGSCDFITRRHLWYQHIAAFGIPECGDYNFLKSMWPDAGEVVWLDEQLAAVQRISKGRPE